MTKYFKKEGRKACEILKLNDLKFKNIQDASKEIEKMMADSMGRKRDNMWGITFQGQNWKKPRKYMVDLIQEYNLVAEYCTCCGLRK